MFGERADTIVALALMRIIRPESLRNVADQFEESFLPELLEMDDELTLQFLSRFLSELRKDERARQRLFGTMIDNDDVLVYDLTSFKSHPVATIIWSMAPSTVPPACRKRTSASFTRWTAICQCITDFFPAASTMW